MGGLVSFAGESKPERGLSVVIVGAGLGGLTCAIACRRANPALRVTVLERTPEILTVGAGIHIPPNACRILTKFGLLAKLKGAGAYQQDFFRLRRYSTGEAIANKPLKTRTTEVYGAEWIVMHRGDFQRVLVEEALSLGVDILTGAEVIDVIESANRQKLNIKGGKIIEADVVIGADGLWSRVRHVVLGRSFTPATTGDLAYRGTFNFAQLKALRNERLDKLLEQSDTHVWLGPGKHAVFYPLRNRTEYNLVLVTADDLPRDTPPHAENIGDITSRFLGWDPMLIDIISIMQTTLTTRLYHFKELDQWTKNTITLMGDASHPTAPYQGQGAAMAVEDGAILGMLLGRFQEHARFFNQDKTSRLVSSLFSMFEKLRKERTKINVEGAVNTQYYYHLPDGSEQQARDKALSELPLENWESSCVFNWGDAQYQKDLLGFDVLVDAEAKYDEWEKKTVLHG